MVQPNTIILAKHFTKLFMKRYVLIIIFKSDTKLVIMSNTPVGRIKTLKNSPKLKRGDKINKNELKILKFCAMPRKTNTLITM